MTRKEKEQKVLELFGLKVGDKIKIEKAKNFYLKSNILQIVECKEPNGEDYFGCLENGEDIPFTVVILFKEDWQKVEPSVKDKKCKDFEDCTKCPFYKSGISCIKLNLSNELPLEEYYKKAKEELDKIRVQIYGDEK